MNEPDLDNRAVFARPVAWSSDVVAFLRGGTGCSNARVESAAAEIRCAGREIFDGLLERRQGTP